jgi:hypothetical protein
LETTKTVLGVRLAAVCTGQPCVSSQCAASHKSCSKWAVALFCDAWTFVCDRAVEVIDHACELACAAATHLVAVAQTAIRDAQVALDWVVQQYSTLAAALTRFVHSPGAARLLDIRSLQFAFSTRADDMARLAGGASVTVAVDAVVLGVPVAVPPTTVNLLSLQAAAAALGNQFIAQIKTMTL